MEKSHGVLVLRSFYESLQELEEKDQLEIYNAIMDYGLNNNEPTFTNRYLNAIWKTIKPNMDINIKRYSASKENGKKGGRPTNEEKKAKEIKYRTQSGEPTSIDPNDYDKAGTCVEVIKTDLSNDNTKVIDEPTSTEIEPQNEDNEPTIIDILKALPFSEIEFKLNNGVIVNVCDKHLDIWNKRKDGNTFIQDMRKINDQFMFSYKLENIYKQEQSNLTWNL